MSQVFPDSGRTARPADRRLHLRQSVRSLAYVELGQANGGIVLNVSEGGMAVQAVMSLVGDELPVLRLQLAHSKRIEAKGRVVWTGGLGKLAGVEFVGLSAETNAQIREWVARESVDSPQGEEARDVARLVSASGAHPDPPRQIAGLDDRTPAKKAPILPTQKSGPTLPVSAERSVPTKDAAANVIPARAAPPAGPPKPQAPGPAVYPARQPSAPPPAVDRPSNRPPEPQVAAKASASPVDVSLSARNSSSPAMSKEASPAIAPVFNVVLTATAKRSPADLPPDRFGFKPIAQPPPIVKTGLAETQNRWKLPAWVASFTVLALAAGWSVGHGALPGVFHSAAGTGAAEMVPAEDRPEPTTQPAPNVAEIEVIDLENQRWLIPMQGRVRHSRTAPTPPPESKTLSDAGSAPLDESSVAADPTGKAEPLPPTPPSDAEHVAATTGAGDTRDSLPTPAPPAPAATSQNNRLQTGELAYRVEPVYPPDAIANRIEGAVKIYAEVDPSGSIKSLRALSGPEALVPAALAAARQWHYNPTMLDGKAIPTERQITIVFRLTKPE